MFYLEFSQKLPLSQQTGTTFTTTVDETEKETLSPRGTYIIPKNGAAAAAADGANTTFNVNPTAVPNSKAAAISKTSASSIMTEDDSDSDCGARKHRGTKSKKDPKELFK